jgi:peptide/nickel transport system permease protein
MAVAEPHIPVVERRGRRAVPRAVPRAAALGRLSFANKLALGSLVLVTLLAVFAPFFAPHDPIVAVGPSFQKPLQGGYLLGTDDVGRDIFSRVLYGLRSSWLAAFVVIASGVVIGGAVGVVAGALGGVVDSVLMRITDVFLSLPGPVLAITVVAALGPSLQHTLIAVGVVWWPFYARIVRGEIRSLVARPHVEAARLAGAGRLAVMWRHLVPGAVPATIVTASLDVSALLLTLSSLSFLGLGSPAPSPELGAMSARGLTYLLEKPWVSLGPASVVFTLSLLANFAGDAVRDLLGDR